MYTFISAKTRNGTGSRSLNVMLLINEWIKDGNFGLGTVFGHKHGLDRGIRLGEDK